MLLSGAVAVMIVLAFLIPLGFLVRDLARDRALSDAERSAQIVAQNLALVDGTDVARVSAILEAVAVGADEEISVIFPDGQIVGSATPNADTLSAARSGESITTSVTGGAVVAVPVVQVEGTPLVVWSFVADALLRKNVVPVLFLLAGLGVALVLIAVLVADRLGRSVVEPVRQLSQAAGAVTHGDLTARVDPAGPPEVAEVGAAFNRLVDRIGALLSSERESIADLAHRLRTPLTALRLNVESVVDAEAATRLQADVDELERTVDFVINEARRPVREGIGSQCDLGSIARERSSFWGALAEEQQRAWRVIVSPGPHPVGAGAADVAAAVDALIGNVFDHTPLGVGFEIEVSVATGGGRRLVVRDAGPGYVSAAVAARGSSTRASTGLGLDIARRTAEAAGGTMSLGSAPTGGAEAILQFAPV